MTDQQYLTDQSGRKLAIVVPLESPVPAAKALFESLSPEELEKLYIVLLQIRAFQAVENIRRHSERSGLDKMTPEEIAAEIEAAHRGSNDE